MSGDAAIHAAAERIGCEARVLLAVIETESAGHPFDGSGRLIILPEKHVFWRELPKVLRNAARTKGLAVPNWSRANYKGLGGSGSDARWDRLEAMTRMNETAGLRSTSYGGPQIMGFNAELCGYASVQAFVLAFAQSEAAQQEAFITYLEKVGLAQALRDKDFRAIARRYNGSGQVSRYASMMGAAYNRLAEIDGADLVQDDTRLLRLGSEGYRVKALQKRLVELGYHVRPDSDFGPATRRAVVAFQVDSGLKPDGVVGEKTEDALQTAVPVKNQPGNSRDGMTVKDLRKSGSETIRQADRLSGLGVTLAGGGAVAKALDGVGGLPDVEALRGVTDLMREVSALASPLAGIFADNKWLVLLVIGGVVYMVARKIKLRRLSDAQSWRHVG